MSSLQFEFIKVARASEKTSMLLPYISVHFVWADVCVYVSIGIGKRIRRSTNKKIGGGIHRLYSKERKKN